MKRILILIMLFMVSLSACNIVNDDLDQVPSKDTIDNGDTDKNEENNASGDTSIDNNPDDSENNGSNNEKEDPIEKQFSIAEPIFDTPILNSIEEVSMEDFFNLGNRVDIKVNISEQELRKLQNDYETGRKSEIYRLANKVTITLKNYNNSFVWEFENVGIRQKGNTSRQNIINGDGSINLNHYKLSFDETFDDPQMYDSEFIALNGNQLYKSREFLGMSGLDFKWNKNYDQTHIKEVYANYLYRACGILVQHVGLSTFSLVETDKGNKETSMGLCTVFEPATKSLIKRSLKSDTNYINMSDWTTEKLGSYGVSGAKYGDLYKCSWGADLTTNSIGGDNIGISNISGSYVPKYDRKTNKDVSYNDTLLRTAVNAIESGNYETISKYVDLEYLAICEAVGFVVGNPDSMRYNMNNYMIYLRRTDGKMVFIPIDSDRCFGITRDWNPKDGNMHLEMLDRKNSNNNDTLKLLLNTILASSNNDAKKLYIEYCNKIKESSWSSTKTFNQYFEMAKASYSNYDFSLNDSNYSFENFINNKLQHIYPISDTGSNDNNTSGSNSEYNNLYIVGTFNNWGDYPSSDLNKYKLNEISDNTYSVTVTIGQNAIETNENGDYIKLKFNNGYKDYSQIDWTLTEDLKTLVMSKGSSAKCYNVKAGDIITVTINTKTLEAIVEIN